MKTTRQWLDAVKTALDIQSDYALAKRLGVQKTRIANYRTERSFLDEDMALRIAEALGIDAGLVLASAAAERAKRPDVKQAWERIAKTMSAAVLALVFMGFSLLGGSPAKASDGQIFSTTIYIIRSARRLLRRVFGLAFSTMKGFMAMVFAASITACGSQQPAPDNNHGYGFSFDAITPSGLRLRYMPGTPQNSALGTAEHRAAVSDVDFLSAEDCTQLKGPPPLIIIVPAGTLAPNDGWTDFRNNTVLIEDTDDMWKFEWALRHEFTHVLLNENSFPSDLNAAHDSTLFTTCKLY